ncbi:MAG TPA: C1 family peptidase [Devosia sp.]|nr:C1 family peptidase [Devosia sp.]
MGAVIAAVLTLAAGIGAAAAQDHPYATGGAPTPAAEKQGISQAPAFRDFLPEAVDLSHYMPPVGDQGKQGSCVGWATAYAARAYYAEQVEHRDISLPQNVPSPAWLFDIIHLGGDCEQGAYIPDAMKVLMTGAYSLKDFPYDDTKCPRPLPPARVQATDFRIDSFEQVYDQQADPDNLDKIKGAISTGNPVVILASLDNGFFDLSPQHKVWHSDASQKDVGGHAITLVGYDDRTQTFKFINQWSTKWGDQGYGYMTYDTFEARVYEGFIMHLPGDPEITLTSADLNPAEVVDAPLPPPPKIILSVTPVSESRDLGLTPEAPIDVGTLSCGKVDIAKDAQGNTIATGFVGTQAELDQVQAKLQGKVDDDQVTLAPWPACEVRLTLADQLADSDPPQAVVDPTAPKVGDTFRVGIESPGFASYLYAAYVGADGQVTTLAQPSSADLQAKPAHTQLKFGDADASGVGLTVSKPVGDEMLVVLASEKPLFAAALPDSQTDRQFLSGLRDAVLSGKAGRVTATLVPVTTAE